MVQELLKTGPVPRKGRAPAGQVPHRTTREEPVCPISRPSRLLGGRPHPWQGDSAVAQGTPWSPATRDRCLSVLTFPSPRPGRPGLLSTAGRPCLPFTMD